MSMTGMFVEKALESYADKTVVNTMAKRTPFMMSMPSKATKRTPFMMSMPSKATNKGRENIYEKVVDIDAIPMTELDAPLQGVSSSSELGREGLMHWSAKQDVGVGALNEMGVSAPAYFASKASKIFGKTAQNFETTAMYQNVQATALANNASGQPFAGTRVSNFGGTTANNYSIQIVTWDNDSTTGLYSPTAFGQNGSGFDVAQVGRGTRIDENGVEVYTYSYRMDRDTSLLL